MWAYDRWGAFLGEVSDLESARHSQKINSKDSLDMRLGTVLAKGDRILWRYNGVWREHVVASSEQEHATGQTFECQCEWSAMADLRLAHVRQCAMASVTARTALSTLLELTRWEVGEVEDFGTADVVLEVQSAWTALLEIAGVFGCEIEAEIVPGDSGVASRKINLRHRVGADKPIRFDYGDNMAGVVKEVGEEDVYTAVYGYGKSLDTKTDGIQNRLMFSVGGKPYLEDSEALELWGVPDGKGGKAHAFGFYENSSCESASQLIDETRAYLDEHKSPKVTYRTDIPFAQLEGVEIGDAVQVVDRGFTTELRIEARIGEMTRDLVSGKTSSAVFGSVRSLLPDVLARTFSAAKTSADATKAASSAYAEAQRVGEALDELGESVTTKEITLTDGENAGTLTIRADGLYFNDVKIGGLS